MSRWIAGTAHPYPRVAANAARQYGRPGWKDSSPLGTSRLRNCQKRPLKSPSTNSTPHRSLSSQKSCIAEQLPLRAYHEAVNRSNFRN